MYLSKYKLLTFTLALLLSLSTFPLSANAAEANPLKTVSEPSDDTIVRVLDYIPEICQSLAYASADNISDQPIYDFIDAYLRYGTVKKLAAANTELSTFDLGILILDAYRPLDCQKQILQLCSEENLISRHVDNDSLHCHGNTIDMVLVDLRTGEMKAAPRNMKTLPNWRTGIFAIVRQIRQGFLQRNPRICHELLYQTTV